MTPTEQITRQLLTVISSGQTKIPTNSATRNCHNEYRYRQNSHKHSSWSFHSVCAHIQRTWCVCLAGSTEWQLTRQPLPPTSSSQKWNPPQTAPSHNCRNEYRHRRNSHRHSSWTPSTASFRSARAHIRRTWCVCLAGSTEWYEVSESRHPPRRGWSSRHASRWRRGVTSRGGSTVSWPVCVSVVSPQARDFLAAAADRHHCHHHGMATKTHKHTFHCHTPHNNFSVSFITTC